MNKKHKTIPIFVPHWGCPQDCLFCDQKKITGQKEPMTPEWAEKIIQKGIAAKEPGDFLEVGFFGGSFTGIPKDEQEALLQVAKKALDAGKIDAIRLSTRPDYINETVIERLLRFGVHLVELGAQSMEDRVLKNSHRGHTKEDTVKAAHLLQKAGIQVGVQMMLGLPGDRVETMLNTADELISLNPVCVRIYPTLVISGTGLDALYKKGAYRPLTLDDAVKTCARLYKKFTLAGVCVIRMGLLDMAPDDIVAGPFHPAFGELVKSEIFYDELLQALQKTSNNHIKICIHPKDVSSAIGQKKSNLHRLQKELSPKTIEFAEDKTIERGKFFICT